MTGDLAGLKRTLSEHTYRGTTINQFSCFGGVPMLAVAAHYQQVGHRDSIVIHKG